jgi:hypothetical protein
MKTTATAALSTALALTLAASAHAGFTTVKPAPGSEKNHQQILGLTYGGSFLLNEGSTPTYSNGSLTFTRVDDSGLGGVLAIVTSDTAPTDDQRWSAGDAVGPTTVIARAKYAGDSHVFGWIDDTRGSAGFQSLIGTTTFNSPVTVNLTSSFRWALKDTTTNKTWTSRNSDNLSDGKSYDQMTTYRVTGAGITQPTYLLFWEDRIGGGADYDYNDAVIEITAVPAPGGAGLALLGAAGLLRRKR